MHPWNSFAFHITEYLLLYSSCCQLITESFIFLEQLYLDLGHYLVKLCFSSEISKYGMRAGHYHYPLFKNILFLNE